MSPSAFKRPLVLAFTLVLGLFALSASPALAEVVHPYRTDLTGTPTGPGGAEVPFGDVCGVTVDPATGDLYVADPDNNVIDVFSAAGVYQRQISGAGIPSGHFGPTGLNPYTGEVVFGGACSVAVSDKTGDVYVAESVSDGEVTKQDPGFLYVFDAKGEYRETMNGSDTPAGSFQSIHVAVDQSSGDVYVADAGHELIDVFNEKNEYMPLCQLLDQTFSDGDGDRFQRRSVCVLLAWWRV
jgi:DNA-binding beta-propeller fold protein YncE